LLGGAIQKKIDTNTQVDALWGALRQKCSSWGEKVSENVGKCETKQAKSVETSPKHRRMNAFLAFFVTFEEAKTGLMDS